MSDHLLSLHQTGDGEIQVTLRSAGAAADTGAYAVPAAGLQDLIERADKLLAWRKTKQPPTRALLGAFGAELADRLLGPLRAVVRGLHGRLWIVSNEADLLNLPFEIIPHADGSFLIEGGHLRLRRATSSGAVKEAAAAAERPGPLRVLFMACSPQNDNRLAFEKEEEAMVKLFLQGGTQAHLEFAEHGTFEELAAKVASYKPHIVHLSGHATLAEDGQGYFLFENERGQSDARPASEITARIFANSGVGMVFVSGCETARSGLAGLCQALINSGHIPLALGWGMPVIDDLATLFAISLYKGLGAGRGIDTAIDHARTELLAACPIPDGHGGEVLLTDFALPRLFAAAPVDTLFDPKAKADPPPRGSFRPSILGDNIVGLTEGFVGRRRILQRTLPVLRDGDGGKTILLLTGIGGAGKSTLATRLANKLGHAGYRIVALRHREGGLQDLFAVRLLQELSIAAISLGSQSPAAQSLLGDKLPMPMRLRLAIEVLNELPLLLVLDNLESLMPPPPASPEWLSSAFGAFFTELTQRLTGAGRAILTCRYVPAGFELPLETDTSPVLHFPMPDFTEADFLKCVEYDARAAARLASGELTKELILEFQRKLGATPRFVKQALPVLSQLTPEEIAASLARIGEEAISDQDTESDDELRQLQQKYFADLFLPDLYTALSQDHRTALSRFAVSDLPLPLDGVAATAGLTEDAADEAITAWLRLGLVQLFDDREGPELFGIYPLQRAFLTSAKNLPEVTRKEAHRALAAWLKECSDADREKDLGLHWMAIWYACLVHAQIAGDIGLMAWSAKHVGAQLYRASEFYVLRDFAEKLMQEERHPEFLKLAADAMSSTGHWREARLLLKEAAPKFIAIDDRAGEAAAWHQIATIDLKEGNNGAARAGFHIALGIETAIADRVGESATLHQLALIELNEGNYTAARTGFHRALKIKKEIGDLTGQAATLHQLATVDTEEGKYSDARISLNSASQIFESAGDPRGIAATWHQLATIDSKEGQHAAARLGFQKALDIRQTIGDRSGEAATWHNLANTEYQEGNYAVARIGFQRSLELKQAIGDRAGEAFTWASMAILAARLYGTTSMSLHLAALAWFILKSTNNGLQEIAFDNMAGMAGDLNLTPEAIAVEIQAALASYQQDRGAALLAAAFPEEGE